MAASQFNAAPVAHFDAEEEAEQSLWQWLGVEETPASILKQQQLLGDHSQALESGVTGLARIARRLDHSVAALAHKVAEHEGTAEAMEHEDKWLGFTPNSSRASTPAGVFPARAQSPLATSRGSTPAAAAARLPSVPEPAAALEAEIQAQEEAESAATATAAAEAAAAATAATKEAAAVEAAAAKEAAAAAAAEAEQSRLAHEAAMQEADAAEQTRLAELEKSRLEAAERERLRLETETKQAAEAAAVALAAQEAAAAVAKAQAEAAAAAAATAQAEAEAAVPVAAAMSAAPAPAPVYAAPTPANADGPAIRSIAGNFESLQKLKATVNAEAQGRLDLFMDFTAHQKQMGQFEIDIRGEMSKLQYQADENDKRLRGLDLRVSKVERPSNAASVTMGLPEDLAPALEFIETQVRQLELKMTNIENGVGADSPIAAEMERMLNRVRGVESHTQRQSVLIDHVVHQLEAEAAAEAVLTTVDPNEIQMQFAQEQEKALEKGEDPPQHIYESKLFENVHARATAIGTHLVTQHLTAHHLPGHGGKGINLLACFHHWTEALSASKGGNSGGGAGLAGSFSCAPVHAAATVKEAAIVEAKAADEELEREEQAGDEAAIVVAKERAVKAADAVAAYAGAPAAAAADGAGDADGADEAAVVPNVEGTPIGDDEGANPTLQRSVSKPALNATTRRVHPNDEFAKILEEKVSAKMERQLALAKKEARIRACELEEAGLRETKAEKADLDALVADAEEMQKQLGRMEGDLEIARAQAEAAAAAVMNMGAGGGMDMEMSAALRAGSAEQEAMLAKLREQLEGLEGTVEDQNKAALDRIAALQKSVDPLTGLPFDINKMRLEDLPDKASALDLEKLKLAQEQALKDMEALANSSMTPEMEAALAELMSMRDMKALVGEQGRQLADLFTTKVGGDDLSKVTEELAMSDQKLEERLNEHVLEMVTQFQEAKEAQAAQFGELDATVNAKADMEWMQSLEKEIIGEVERLRAAGKSVITKPELEKKLAELRRKMKGSGGMEVGSAAFRCIACNRPLPDMSQWHIDLANSTHTTKVSKKPAKFGTGSQAGLPQHEIVLRGGFPMVNPKVKSKDRKVAGDLRLFGRNMMDVNDEGEYELPSQIAEREGSTSRGGSRSGSRAPRRSNPGSSPSSPASLAPLEEKGQSARRVNGRGSPVPAMPLNMRPSTSNDMGGQQGKYSSHDMGAGAAGNGAMHTGNWPSASSPQSFGSISPDPIVMGRHSKAHRPQTSLNAATGGLSPVGGANAQAAANFQAQNAKRMGAVN